jgi:hypothetical protein
MFLPTRSKNEFTSLTLKDKILSCMGKPIHPCHRIMIAAMILPI